MYSYGHMMMFLSLVLNAATSLRCASRGMRIAFSGLTEQAMSIPQWTTGRLWLLRLGYYKLSRAKEKAQDWIWIGDHSIQMGTQKCLVILGLRLSQLFRNDMTLKHEDVEIIELLPVHKSDGDVVYKQLEKATKKTGVPREIIGDYGSDLKKGIEKFCEKHKETSYVYDMKHKTARILKHELENDETWKGFNRLVGETRQKIRQTPLAHLAPPNQRDKARYMNMDEYVKWGVKICLFLKNLSPHKTLDPKKVIARLGWVLQFDKALQEWREMLEITGTAEHTIRTRGFYQGCHSELEEQLKRGSSERTERIRNELLQYVVQESSKARPGERLLGSSEVIESLFGKMKRMEQNQSKSGFTPLVLSIGAMVSTTTQDVIRKALETVSTKKVLTWAKKTLGESVQSKRKKFLTGYDAPEQNRGPLRVPEMGAFSSP